jgi:hypothetical protein
VSRAGGPTRVTGRLAVLGVTDVLAGLRTAGAAAVLVLLIVGRAKRGKAFLPPVPGSVAMRLAPSEARLSRAKSFVDTVAPLPGARVEAGEVGRTVVLGCASARRIAPACQGRCSRFNVVAL